MKGTNPNFKKNHFCPNLIKKNNRYSISLNSQLDFKKEVWFFRKKEKESVKNIMNTNKVAIKS